MRTACFIERSTMIAWILSMAFIKNVEKTKMDEKSS
jgi:hypothetical protein